MDFGLCFVDTLQTHCSKGSIDRPVFCCVRPLYLLKMFIVAISLAPIYDFTNFRASMDTSDSRWIFSERVY